MFFLLVLLLSSQYYQLELATLQEIQLLCGEELKSGFTTQIHVPGKDYQEGVAEFFFFFTQKNFFVDYNEDTYQQEVKEIQIDENQPTKNFEPIFIKNFDKDYKITVDYQTQLFAPFEVGEFEFVFELYNFNAPLQYTQKVTVVQRKGIFEEIRFDQEEVGKIGCLQMQLLKPFNWYPKDTLIAVDLGTQDIEKLSQQKIEVFIKNDQIKSVEWEVQENFLVVKNFDRNDFYGFSAILDLQICNIEVPFVTRETQLRIYSKEIKPKYNLFQASKKLTNNMPKYEMDFILNNSLTEDKIFLLDFYLKTNSVSVVIEKGFRMVFLFQGQQTFNDIQYRIYNHENNGLISQGSCSRIGEYLSMEFQEKIDLKVGFKVELQSKEKVQHNIQMNQILFNFMTKKSNDLLLERELVLPLFVFQSAKFQNILTLSDYNAGQQSTLTLLLSRDQVGFIKQQNSDITIYYNNIVFNSDNTIVKFKSNNQSVENEKFDGGITIKNFPIQKYAKIEFEIQFLKNSWFDNTIKDVLVEIKNGSEKFSETFLLQLIRPQLQVQDFSMVHFQNKFQTDFKILISEQMLANHSLRVAIPKSLYIENQSKCAKIKQMGQIKDLNCFTIDDRDDEKFYFKIENPFTQIQPQLYSEMQFIGQTFDYETQDQKIFEFDIIGHDKDNIFDEPFSNVNLSYKKQIQYEIPCAQNCQFCFTNVFSCDLCQDGYQVNNKECVQTTVKQNDLIFEQLDLVYTASFFTVVRNILISLSFLGLMINLYLKFTFKNKFDIIEGLIVIFSFQHSLLNYSLLYQVCRRSETKNQLVFVIILVLIAIVVNLLLTIYIATKKNFLYSKVRIFNIRSDSILFMIFYIFFGTGCSLWIAAFKYMENLGKLYFTGKDKKQFRAMTRTLKISNSIFVLLETIIFLMIFLLNSDKAQIIFIYFASGIVLFILLLISLLTTKKTVKENKLLFVSSVVNPVTKNFKYIQNIEEIENLELDETSSEDPHEKELIRIYLGNLRERYQSITKRSKSD